MHAIYIGGPAGTKSLQQGGLVERDNKSVVLPLYTGALLVVASGSEILISEVPQAVPLTIIGRRGLSLDH